MDKINVSPLDGLTGVCKSFFSKAFYSQVSLKWTGCGLLYLLLISCLFSLSITAARYFSVADCLGSSGLEEVFKSMPELDIKNGELSTLRQDLIVLRLKSKQASAIDLIVIDPKNTISNFEQAKAPVLLQSKTFYVQLKPGRAATKLKYSQFFKDGKIEGQKILNQLKDLANVLLLPFFVLIASLHFSFVLTRSLLIALFLKLFRMKTGFKSILRLLIVASTPSSLMTAISMALSWDFGNFEQPLFSTLFLAYAVFAFHSARTAVPNKDTA